MSAVFEVIYGTKPHRGPHDVVFLADHASNTVPDDMNGLGLAAKYFDQHIGYDIGAETMSRELVRLLGGAAVLACFSRLIIDPNREHWRADLVPTISDGIPIPGNQDITAEDEKARIDRFHTPYHQACEDVVGGYLQQSKRPPVVGIHSFTPHMDGFDRPWHIGFMWNDDARLGLYLAKYFEDQGFCAGHNQPYGGDDLFGTIMRHGHAHKLLHTQIEVRQDLVGTEKDALAWAGRIADALQPVLENPDMLD